MPIRTSSNFGGIVSYSKSYHPGQRWYVHIWLMMVEWCHNENIGSTVWRMWCFRVDVCVTTVLKESCPWLILCHINFRAKRLTRNGDGSMLIQNPKTGRCADVPMPGKSLWQSRFGNLETQVFPSLYGRRKDIQYCMIRSTMFKVKTFTIHSSTSQLNDTALFKYKLHVLQVARANTNVLDILFNAKCWFARLL